MTVRFWKPYGVLTQFTDADGRPTLADFGLPINVYAAGRLDMDSEGLLILSDHGPTIARLSAARSKTPKTYLAQVDGMPSPDALRSLREGVALKDGLAKALEAELLTTDPAFPPRDPPIRVRRAIPASWVRLVVDEGRNRMVRRMTAAIGHGTLRLVRSQIGPYNLDGLGPGKWDVISESTEPTPSFDRRSDRGGYRGRR